jgi:hypothetical protein
MISSPAIVRSGYSQNAATANTISILSSSSFRDDTGTHHIVSDVKNNSPTDSTKYVKIVVTLFDSSGKVVGADFTYADVGMLRPAEKSSFKIILTDIRKSKSK